MTSVYAITISNPGGTSAPSDGFIDPTRVEEYIPDLSEAPSDFTIALSTAKRRANLRFQNLLQQMGIAGNMDVDPNSITTPGASYKAEPSSFGFQVLLPYGDSELYTPDELNPGSALSGIPALTRIVARALVWSGTRTIDVYDPTALVTFATSMAYPRFGERVAPIQIGGVETSLATAASLVTVVTKFDNYPPN